jgi:hypothetical protein
MNEAPVTDRDVSAGLSEVLRLTTALADRILAELAAGQTIARDRSEALANAVNELRRQGVTLPPSLEQTIQEISRRAMAAIKRAEGSTTGSVSWTFGRLRGRQRMILSAPKPSV